MTEILRIAPRSADLGGGLQVHRTLPTRPLRMVGAWCFLDHAGPTGFEAGGGMHVGAHPHIGLQTFTWLIEGEVLHRDSLGNTQVIRPGEVNLMTAGRGIAHTEDCTADSRRLHAAQLWIALPPGADDIAPDFAHHPDLPRWKQDAAELTLLAGRYGDDTAPARLHAPLIGLDIASTPGGTTALTLDADFEYAVSVLAGGIDIDGGRFGCDELAYLGSGRTQLQLTLAPDSRVLLLGGEPFRRQVLMWWNFVAFDKATIVEAQRQWEAGDPRFGPVGDGSAPRLAAPPLPWYP